MDDLLGNCESIMNTAFAQILENCVHQNAQQNSYELNQMQREL